jgi:hypothetical protein
VGGATGTLVNLTGITKGKNFYAYGLSNAWTGKGYTAYTTFKTPNGTVG